MNPTRDPKTARYKTAATECHVGIPLTFSPASKLTARTSMPLATISAALAISPDGSDIRLLHTEPNDQETAEIINTIAPSGLAFRSASKFRITTPASPSISPAHSRRDGLCAHIAENITVQRGTVATKSAASPEPIHCSANATP